MTTTAIFANSLSVEAVHFTAAQSVRIMTGMHGLDASSVLQEISCKDRLHTLEKLVQSTRGGLTTLGKFSRWRLVK